jgi:hypothetical protein
MKHLYSLLYALILCIPLAAHPAPRRCIILLNKNDFAEHVGRAERFYLMSKLQAAIEEQSTPILLHASLLNSFIERRAFFAHALNDETSQFYRAYDLYLQINERIAHWHNHYRARLDDVVHIKELIVQHINQEFYIDAKTSVTDVEYQLLLNYHTNFDPADWQIYTNLHGFFLLLPNRYCSAVAADYDERAHGFRISSLTRVEHPEQAGSLYFASRLHPKPISEQLADFFIMDTDSYNWDIILSGHGGSTYYETMNDDGTLSWHAVPIIADLPLDQFHALLTFFNDRVNTHSLHYSSCFSGGHHSVLPFQQSYHSYNYALIYACLTDCACYCAWQTNLPSSSKNYLSTADLVYNAGSREWHLPITAPYNWNRYFDQVTDTNFNAEDVTALMPGLEAISQNMIEDLCSICMPHGQRFYHFYPPTFSKMSDDMVTLAQDTKKPIHLGYAHTVLLESSCIEPTIILTQPARFISIKPGHAIHWCKKINAQTFLDITDAFWQLCGQWFDKTFLIDELTCPADFDVLMRKYQYETNQKDLALKHILIHVHKDHLMRIFLTLNDNAYMIMAHNPDLLQYKTTIQAIVLLDDAARAAYEKEYTALTQKAGAYIERMDNA